MSSDEEVYADEAEYGFDENPHLQARYALEEGEEESKGDNPLYTGFDEDDGNDDDRQDLFNPPSRRRLNEALMQKLFRICSKRRSTEEEKDDTIRRIEMFSAARGFYPKSKRYHLLTAAIDNENLFLVTLLVGLGCIPYKSQHQVVRDHIMHSIPSDDEETYQKYQHDSQTKDIVDTFRNNAEEERKQQGKYLHHEAMYACAGNRTEQGGTIGVNIKHNDPSLIVNALIDHEHPDMKNSSVGLFIFHFFFFMFRSSILISFLFRENLCSWSYSIR